MATIGIAFALGFIIGPALGGILSMVDLTKYYPALAAYGVNPFSMPALLAFILSAFNLFYLAKKFKETLPAEKRGMAKNQRITNPLKLFRPLPYKGVNLTNFGHFLFLAAFSGMEFTLTFLAVERLSYTSMDNAYMFIYIGIIIALVQGGYVRRKAAIKGEKNMALQGLLYRHWANPILMDPLSRPLFPCCRFINGYSLSYFSCFPLHAFSKSGTKYWDF
jgi:MFS family permease